MSGETIAAIVTGVVSLICGGGGLFAYLSARAQNKVTERSSSVAEWKELYDEMKARLDSQEKENEELRDRVAELTQEISKLRIEVNNYKKYDKYVSKMEIYIDTLLSALKPLITSEAYESIVSKKPEKEPEELHNTPTSVS